MITNSLPTPEQMALLNTSVEKALRYQKALLALEANQLCKDYINFKPTFKAFAQERLSSGMNAVDLTKSANERLQSESAAENYGKKVKRYEKKMKQSDKALLATKDESISTFEKAESVFKEKFEAVRKDPTANAIYREFRIAKKGLPDDPTKYVGFFKFMKKKENRPIIKQFAKLLSVKCKEAGVTHQKIYNKIKTASV